MRSTRRMIDSDYDYIMMMIMIMMMGERDCVYVFRRE
jgi:hypothetical protein